MIINIEPTSREEARSRLEKALQTFSGNGAVSEGIFKHYDGYLAESKAIGERDTSKDPWNPEYNHRAKEGDPFAINGTYYELVFEAALHTLGQKVDPVQDKIMQMYGQDFINRSSREQYSVKGRRHQLDDNGEFIFELTKADFAPGLYRVTHLVFVDPQSEWITFLGYRKLFPYCCVANEKHICVDIKRDKLSVHDFEAAAGSDAVRSLDISYLWSRDPLVE